MSALDVIGVLSGHALHYAHEGLEVFPANAATKAPMTHHGLKDASSDELAVRLWWSTYPSASIACRIPEGMMLLDVDPRHGGDATWAALIAEFGAFPETRVHYSGREDNGGHVWFQRPPGALSTRALDEWARAHGCGEHISDDRHTAGIDLLHHELRYTILPPSLHAITGRPYRWKGGGLSVPVSVPPSWLVELITTPSERAGEAPERELPLAQAQTVSSDSIADWYSSTQRWASVLEPHGWRLRSGDGDSDGSTWLHPRATSDKSATVRHGCLFVYSPNTPLPVTSDGDPHGLTRFAAFAVLSCWGNESEAGARARELRYGPATERFSVYDFGAIQAERDAPPPTVATEGHRLVLGGEFILDAPTTVPAVWGSGDDVLWAQGEPFYLVGPPGVGKTTLMGQVLFARLGLGGEVLGYPVQLGKRRVLYLAADRPQQIARSLRRHARPEHREELNDRLRVLKGPPLADLAKQTDYLLNMAHDVDADMVILDSLKDMAVGISDDATGSGLNKSVQLCLAEGVEVGGLHHQRKTGSGDKPPTTLADVYGSTWITAGAGSVILLWGQAGDPLVALTHLKQPASPIGPLEIAHDHMLGTTRVEMGFDLSAFMRARPNGVRQMEVAKAWHGPNAENKHRMQAKRKLDRLVSCEKATESDGVYRLVEP